MSELEEMFAEAIEAEVDETPVDDSAPDNFEDDDLVDVVEEPESEEIINDDVEDAAEDEDNTIEVPPTEDADLETIIVDGEEIRVTKQELRDGYLRRQDYSRKTAEAAQVKKQAEWAAQIQQAFDTDPAGTIKALSDAYGIRPDTVQQPTESLYEDLDPDVAVVLKKLDEQERRHQQELAEIKRQTDEFSRRAMVEEVKHELDGLRAEYGEDLDEVELLQTAATYNLPLSVAANALMGQKAIRDRKVSAEAASKAEAAAQARKSKQSVEKQAAKKTATSTLSASSSGASEGEISPDDFNSLEELFALMVD